MIARGIHGNLDVLMLARLRLQTKDYAGAARLAQRVLDNDPDNTQARLLLQMAMGQTRGDT
jgi:cytochrome c-type biogenesis protein CcmH/NrfG